MKQSKSANGTVVIKVGTSTLMNFKCKTFNFTAIASLAESVRNLKDAGYNVVVVASGAVGAGCHRVGVSRRPTSIARRQALASVGQMHLVRYFEDFFSTTGLMCSQVLMTRDMLAAPRARSATAAAFNELLSLGIVPIVNENDAMAIDGQRIGDNDTLAAQVAALVRAKWLFLLTDVDGLYTANPSIDPSARRIDVVTDLATLRVNTADANGGPHTGTSEAPGGWGTGGMATKLVAAGLAIRSGVKMIICDGQDPGVVPRVVLEGENIGTVFLPASEASKSTVSGRSRSGQLDVVLTSAVLGMKCQRSRSLSHIMSVSSEGLTTDQEESIDSEMDAGSMSASSSTEMGDMRTLNRSLGMGTNNSIGLLIS